MINKHCIDSRLLAYMYLHQATVVNTCSLALKSVYICSCKWPLRCQWAEGKILLDKLLVYDPILMYNTNRYVSEQTQFFPIYSYFFHIVYHHFFFYIWALKIVYCLHIQCKMNIAFHQKGTKKVLYIDLVPYTLDTALPPDRKPITAASQWHLAWDPAIIVRCQ